MKHSSAPYTVHGVLAGAYVRDISTYTLLRHASQDDGDTALCRKVRAGNLCDEAESEPVTCPACLARIASRRLVAKDVAQ